MPTILHRSEARGRREGVILGTRELAAGLTFNCHS